LYDDVRAESLDDLSGAVAARSKTADVVPVAVSGDNYMEFALLTAALFLNIPGDSHQLVGRHVFGQAGAAKVNKDVPLIGLALRVVRVAKTEEKGVAETDVIGAYSQSARL